jgi:hypothetical protein
VGTLVLDMYDPDNKTARLDRQSDQTISPSSNQEKNLAGVEAGA